ncbi:MAG: cytochrome c [Planctomycetes bacterium]|nr:cytochrome c [Planctomycetota bacterium]
MTNQPAKNKGARARGIATVLSLASFAFALPACQQKMAHQPYFKPLEESTFFADGRSARPREEGTISRAQLQEFNPLVTGLSEKGQVAQPALPTEPVGTIPAAAVPAGAPDNVENYVDAFPYQITADDLRRGMERYTIFCTPCHGVLGNGQGKIVERGYLKPTSYHGEPSRGFGRYRVLDKTTGKPLLLVDAPVGYYFEVISKGFGGMPDHAAQIAPADRWRIIAYVRALQLSQSANLKDLPEALQKAATEQLGGGKKP